MGKEEMGRSLFLSVMSLLAGITLSVIAIGSAVATPLIQTTTWGTLDPACTSEGVTCALDSDFTPNIAGYRAGGSVSWGSGFILDASAFSSITSITMDVLVVGFWECYPGNIDPNTIVNSPCTGLGSNEVGSTGKGQLGDYFAIDGVPFAPFLGMTDRRDTYTFDLTGSLSPGAHTFSVVAYDLSKGPWNEGWAGVDQAILTVTGEAAVPEPASLVLLGIGLASLGAVRRKRLKRQQV